MGTPQKLLCRISDVADHGEGVYTLDIVPVNPPVPRFKAGQFLHLALEKFDPSGFWPESRVFSIASSTYERDSLRITYSVRGRFTARMEKEIRAGCEISIKMPYGDFIVDGSNRVVLFAGGTGVTAFTAFLSGMEASTASRTTLVYGAREARLLVYRPLVERLLKGMPGFRVFYFLEDTAQIDGNELPGKMAAAVVWQYIAEPEKSNYYLSGPPAMLRSVSTQLRGLGIMGGSIHIDAWE